VCPLFKSFHPHDYSNHPFPDTVEMDFGEELTIKVISDFTVQVDGVKGVCPAGEAWAEVKILLHKIPVLSCEGPCVRGDIARRAANG
jgi:hypothetical protein